jgi:hypothetical protein
MTKDNYYQCMQVIFQFKYVVNIFYELLWVIFSIEKTSLITSFQQSKSKKLGD